MTIPEAIERVLELDQKGLDGEWFWEDGFNKTAADPGCFGSYLYIKGREGILCSHIPSKTKDLIAEYRTLAPLLARELKKRMEKELPKEVDQLDYED